MQPNPLLGDAVPQEVAAAAGDQRVIALVSNTAADKIEGLSPFLASFNSDQVRAEVSPFRYVIQRKARRSMGGKFSKGLTHEVTESIEVNPNEDLFGMRRWLGRVRQDPASVLLLNVGKIKEEALAAPLIFSDLLRAGRPVLVTGADRSTQDQLLARIDPAFAQVPTSVQYNQALKTMLLARPQRRKGFAASMRNIVELEFLPTEVREKLMRINAGGDPSELSEPESINLSLLADLASRYRNTLLQYKETLQGGSLSVQQLASMFEVLLADLPLAEAQQAFAEFLQGDMAPPQELRNKVELFSYLNRYLNASEGGSRPAGRNEKLDRVYKRLTSVVIGNRAKADPVLWKRCNFIYEPEPQERQLVEGLEPVLLFLERARDEGEGALDASFKERLGRAVFDLVELCNQTHDQTEGSNGLSRQRAAQHLLPLFQMTKFQAGNLVSISPSNREKLLAKDKFLGLFRNIPVTLKDLEALVKRLQAEVYRERQIGDAVRRSTLDVILLHDRDRQRALRDIYIINAAKELANFTFHIGEQNVTSLDRLCGIAAASARFGFEIALQPTQPESIGLFTDAGTAPLGTLQNDPSVLSRVYTALVGLRVERHVKKIVDHKVGFLQANFGENFFEVVYQTVVNRHDLPVSREQLAWYVRQLGLLGNLGEKGFKAGATEDYADPFLDTAESAPRPGEPAPSDAAFAEFPQRFQESQQAFKQLLAELRAAGAEDATESIRSLLWNLFRRGIYNVEHPEAKEALRKSAFYNQLRDITGRISSENYSVFTREIQQDGVKLFILPRFHGLLTVGNRFSFLVESKIVRYQLLASPVETPDGLDEMSRVFNEKLEVFYADLENHAQFQPLFAAVEEMARATQSWRDYSRHLAFALLDRVLSETVIKQLEPGKVLPQHLWYLPDATKLCLGPALASQKAVPFAKLLQVPENMGNLQKNPKSSSTTIDDFTIEVHKISRLRAELDHYESVAEDVLDILQNLTHERAESQQVARYEQGLAQLIRILSKPLRAFTEREVQHLHTVASAMRATLQAFYNVPGSQRDQLVMRVQNQLQARRSDGHQLKLNFSDVFILDKTEIRVMEKTRQGDETVKRQRKMEVEIDATYQTLPLRIREVIRTHGVLAARQHIVISPEGQKKKQLDYVMDIIDVMLGLRGNSITFYADTGMLSDEQTQRLAAHVKPHNFFRMDELKPEAPEGVSVDGVKDPLTGRLVAKPASTDGGGPASSTAASPA